MQNHWRLTNTRQKAGGNVKVIKCSRAAKFQLLTSKDGTGMSVLIDRRWTVQIKERDWINRTENLVLNTEHNWIDSTKKMAPKTVLLPSNRQASFSLCKQTSKAFIKSAPR